MHLARLAVKPQGQFLVAVDEGEGLGPDGALHAGDPLGLLGAQAHGPAHAVLGDHQTDFAGFLVALVGGGDDVHAMFAVEVTRRVVEHVGQVGERVFRVLHRR